MKPTRSKKHDKGLTLSQKHVLGSMGNLGSFTRVLAELSSSALFNNYEAIRHIVPDQEIMPMVKADAYGHGASWVARNLAHQPGLYGFGVATLEEGMQLRQGLGGRGSNARIVVLSGGTPWSDEKGQFCERYGLTPVISCEGDWLKFVKGRWPGKIPYELKFNTGMNRLGIEISSLDSVAKILRKFKPESHPQGILTHLACAENPEARLSQLQKERFIEIKKVLSPICSTSRFHLANSSAIWNNKAWGLKGLTDVVRPGISLYGVTPGASDPDRGIIPVMTIKACVVATHRLKKGESTGYGPTFTVTGSGPVNIAVLSVGYADGLPRALSNRGLVWLGGKMGRFLGNVSMDMSTVGCTEKTRPGDWAEIVGQNVDIWTQAQAASTIPYEILISVSTRVQRIYV